MTTQKKKDTLEKQHINIVTWFNLKLYQNNVNMALL